MLSSVLKIARMHIKEYTQYNFLSILWTFNRVVEVVVYIFVWQAIYNQTGQIGDFSIEEMVTYYILVVAITPISLWGIDEDIAVTIRKGNIAAQLLNPISFIKYYWGYNLGEMAYATGIGIMTFIICGFLWKVVAPTNFMALLGFILILIINIPISYCLQIIVGACGFYTNTTWGMHILKKSITAIFSGYVAPLAMFPVWFQKIANILPFKEFFYTPINIYLGKTTGVEIIWLVIKQLIWLGILYVIAKRFFNYAVKKVTINGG